MDEFWPKEPRILLKRPNEFWPTPEMHITERLNAITRFLIYASVLLTLLKNDSFYLLFMVILLLVIMMTGKTRQIDSMFTSLQPAHNFPKQNRMTKKKCQTPTNQNPFANVLMTDYENNPNRDPACPIDYINDDIDNVFYSKYPRDKYDVFNTKFEQRQFFSTANTMIPNDQNAFAQYCYGSKPTCKEDTKNCKVL